MNPYESPRQTTERTSTPKPTRGRYILLASCTAAGTIVGQIVWTICRGLGKSSAVWHYMHPGALSLILMLTGGTLGVISAVIWSWRSGK